MKTNIIALIVTALLLSGIQTQAQYISDIEARPSISLEFKPLRNLSISGTYYVYLNDNMSRYKKSVIAGEIGYKINSWLKTGGEYRYGMSDNGTHYNEIRYDLTFKGDISKRLEIKYRPMLQLEFGSLNKDHLAVNPMEYFWANRVTLSYQISKKADIYVFSENYQEIDHGRMGFDKQKSAIGTKLKVGNHSKIDFRVDLINKKKGKNELRPCLNYAITIGGKKKK